MPDPLPLDEIARACEEANAGDWVARDRLRHYGPSWVPALHARVVELEAEVAALREAAKCKTVRTEVRPVPRFDPEGEDES